MNDADSAQMHPDVALPPCPRCAWDPSGGPALFCGRCGAKFEQHASPSVPAAPERSLPAATGSDHDPGHGTHEGMASVATAPDLSPPDASTEDTRAPWSRRTWQYVGAGAAGVLGLALVAGQSSGPSPEVRDPASRLVAAVQDYRPGTSEATAHDLARQLCRTMDVHVATSAYPYIDTLNAMSFSGWYDGTDRSILNESIRLYCPQYEHLIG